MRGVGARTTCLRWCAAPILTGISTGATSMRHRDAVGRHRDVARAQRRYAASRPGESAGCEDGAGRGWRRSLPAARFRRTRHIPWWRSRREKRRHAGRGFRDGESDRRCISARDAFLADPACGCRAGCAWKTRTAPRRRFRSGSGRRRAGRRNYRRQCRGCGAEIAGDEAALDFCSGMRTGRSGRGAGDRVRAGGRAALGVLPSSETVVAERFFDEAGGMQLVLHAPFGSRINRAWGLALRKRFCRTFNFELQAAATDNGIVISLERAACVSAGDGIRVSASRRQCEDVLTQAMLDAPMFGARWRWNATRALAILRFRGRTQSAAADSAHAVR